MFVEACHEGQCLRCPASCVYRGSGQDNDSKLKHSDQPDDKQQQPCKQKTHCQSTFAVTKGCQNASESSMNLAHTSVGVKDAASALESGMMHTFWSTASMF